jgi:hypothetical protein
VYDELEMTWKDAVVAKFKILFQQWPGEAEEKHEKPQSG